MPRLFWCKNPMILKTETQNVREADAFGVKFTQTQTLLIMHNVNS